MIEARNCKVLFHIPKELKADTQYGSRIRPSKLVQAFLSAGCEIEVISGTGRDRKKKIQKTISELDKGRRFDIFYSESSNSPVMVSDDHHLPLTPLADYRFFKTLHDRKIKSGIFYRDIFWKFPAFKQWLPAYQRLLSLPLYKLDWHIYKKYFNHLFLPSLGMRQHLHTPWKNNNVTALPPGGDIKNPSRSTNNDKLVSFYVGGITPPVYDLRDMINVYRVAKHSRLILCCRQKEWQNLSAYYDISAGIEQITVIHKAANELDSYYSAADVFVIAWKDEAYLQFAMPIKLFEAIGYGLPIIIQQGSEAASLVQKNDIGWVINSSTELAELLGYLEQNREQIDSKRENVLNLREQHSWETRIMEIIYQLSK